MPFGIDHRYPWHRVLWCIGAVLPDKKIHLFCEKIEKSINNIFIVVIDAKDKTLEFDLRICLKFIKFGYTPFY